jgi:hypothetical protein
MYEGNPWKKFGGIIPLPVGLAKGELPGVDPSKPDNPFCLVPFLFALTLYELFFYSTVPYEFYFT